MCLARPTIAIFLGGPFAWTLGPIMTHPDASRPAGCLDVCDQGDASLNGSPAHLEPVRQGVRVLGWEDAWSHGKAWALDQNRHFSWAKKAKAWDVGITKGDKTH